MLSEGALWAGPESELDIPTGLMFWPVLARSTDFRCDNARVDWLDIGEEAVPQLVSDALGRGVHGTTEHSLVAELRTST